MSKVEIGTMAIETGVNRANNSRGKAGTTTKEKGTIRRQEILASKYPKITSLLI